MMNGESKDPSQIIYPSDSMSSSTSAIHSIKDAEIGDYCVFIKVSDKFDKDYTYYRVIFNGTPSTFLKKMEEKDYNFNTQNKIWSIR